MRGGTAVCSVTYAFNGICTIEALFLKPLYKAIFDLLASYVGRSFFVPIPNGLTIRRMGKDCLCKNYAAPTWKMVVVIDVKPARSPFNDNNAAFLHR